jgi:penicillin G amidase
MDRKAAKRLGLLTSAVSVVIAIGIAIVAWLYWRVRSSLPQLDGVAAVAGLGGEVTVERDALGVPTIRGGSQADVIRALGWLHAQERFFQMDLLRRSAAGELGEIFGKRLLTRDRATRIHGFRARAREVLARLPEHDRQLLETYVEGVNAGLTALADRPFEYILMRTDPQPWRAEDSVLVVYAKFLDLQSEQRRYEQTLMTLRDELGFEALAFFNPLIGPDDAALDGTTEPLPPIPGPRLLDLRGDPAAPPRARRTGSVDTRRDEPAPIAGSNAFALAGSRTAAGAGLLASDMHLEHGVPNIWYRASLEYPAPGPAAGSTPVKVTGVTLPGTPGVIVGSNGHIAWGFTNASADTTDLVVVEALPGLPSWYIAPGEREGRKMEQRKEVIRLKGSSDVTMETSWTIWGPIIGKTERGRPLALRWVAHEPDAINLQIFRLQHATEVNEAVEIARSSGMPAQNFVVADRAGNIAWTIAGRLPRRVGYDGRLPVSWAFGDRRWDGLHSPEELPALSTKPGLAGAGTLPTEGQIWSANHRHVGGSALAKIGDGDYDRAARARQIRDGLTALERATPRDLLAVQLDTRALFLEPWHRLLMETLTPAVTAQNRARAKLRSFAENWEGHASVDAVSYRLVREFRREVYVQVFARGIFASCVEVFPEFAWDNLNLEPAMWALLRERPDHLLNPEAATWDELLVSAVDDVIATTNKEGVTLPQANWGWSNRARIRHPFGNLLPEWISRRLNMPPDPLPGDTDMPRVQKPSHGASERMVVSPGREAEGIFHMPCGQSAHPMSPFYRAGHAAWVRGEPTPFLPGETKHTLRLAPRGQ